MDSERKDERAVFKAALKIESPTERAAYVRKVCENNAELLARVEALLKSHDQAGSFLGVPVLGSHAESNNNSPIDGPGTRISRYELLELIGEGGMGLVYLAEQTEPVKRKVALKIVKLGMDTKQVVARFEAERQTLALLEHPNIAHVFDAGTTNTGRPYFVMEYVEGKSITKYCDQEKLSVEDRLELFRQVCEGVHHAHQKGIIHRDIKPSNILVSVRGQKAVPKIIDFGIAKAITQPLTEKTSYTEHGQLLGTPEYMSPEQAEMAYKDVDTRSDIYSLGVVLYELLAGATPFDAERLRKGGIDGIQQIICEEEPRTPSARLTNLGNKAEEVARSRRTQIVTLTRRLHRELEWIPMKAMRKDRSRRYRSATELADDIRNYLTGTPLIAGPESTVYRARKFVRKHAGSVATAALLLVVIILGLVASILMGCRAEQAREQEAAARVEAERARDKEVALRAQVERALARAENAEKLADERRKLAEERAEEYRRSLYCNRIALADVAYRDCDIGRLRELLDTCPVDLRGWEWDRLNHISDQAVMTLYGHADRVYCVAISPDGKRIVSGSRDDIIKVWDATTGGELMILRGHEGSVMSVAFSPEGKRIASGSTDKTIRIWDVATGDKLMMLQDEAIVTNVAFSPDGKRLVSGNWNKTVKLWDAANGTEIAAFQGHEQRISTASFTSDGTRVISCSYDKTIRIWDADTRRQLMVLEGHEGAIGGLSISPDGKRLVSGSEDKTAKVWDMATGSEVLTLRGHDKGVLSVAFSLDGTQIVTGGQAIRLWDAARGTHLATFAGHTDMVASVAFSRDGEHIISGGYDGTIKVWEPGVDRTAPLRLRGRHGDKMDFSPDGKYIVTGGKDIGIWDTATGNDVMKIDEAAGSVSFSPDGNRIISARGNDINIWDASNGKKLKTLSGHDDTIWSMSYSPDGKKIASGGKDKTVRIWDANTGAELMTLRGHGDWPEEPNFSPVSSVAFSPDGTQLISGSYDYTVKIWNAGTGAEVMTMREHSYLVNDVAFGPDGKRFASASSDGTIRVCDLATGSGLQILRGHEGEVLSVAFSPDGKRIISGSKDETVRIWDAATGLEITILRIGGKVWSLSFSPDGKTIATASEIVRRTGNTVTLWKSAVPAGPQRIHAAASKLVDELYEEHGSYSAVIDTLKADQNLDESVRKVALKIADTGLWEYAEKLLNQTWGVLILPDRDIDEYRAALDRVERARELIPDEAERRLSVLWYLGVAQYRVGSYEDALETLRRCGKRSMGYLDRAVVAFTAMALHQVGQKEEAKAALERLRDLCKAKPAHLHSFLSEAERIIAGENGGK
jgi:WD40 repeat protein/predicted Ser/Thr protein kinase